jgi:hypothetical protein
VGTTAVRKETLEEVLLRVEQLERRVAALEGRDEVAAAKPVAAEAVPAETPSPRAPAFSLTGGTFATLAKALLGFAGAYLLRAVAESGSFPQSLGILAGLVYAVFWLVWSTRQDPADRFASTLYGCTATLIFAGLVWENSVRFQNLTPAWSAAFVAMFSCVGLFLAWRRRLDAVASIVMVVGSALALALLIATHHLVPFTVALLAIAAATEFAACRGALMGQRWIVGLAADLAVFLTAWAITQPQGLPDGYPMFTMSQVVALQIGLVLIYVLGMGYRTLVDGSDIVHFETGQNVIAIALFIWGSVLMGREAPAVRMFVEAFCVLAGLSCYATAVLFLSRRKRLRNFLMYGLFGLALLMAGVYMLFSGVVLVLVWSVLAIATAWLGTHEHRISLQLHAPVYLASAALVSGLIEFAAHALHGSAAPSGAPLMEIVITTVALALCYWMEGIGGSGNARIPSLLIAALLCWSLLGLGAAGITSTLGPDSFISSTLRTGFICVLALGLAMAGVRSRHRPECVWLLYPLMVYGAYRLLVEDFPNGRPTALALSLLFYGGTLLLLTRVVRDTRR